MEPTISGQLELPLTPETSRSSAPEAVQKPVGEPVRAPAMPAVEEVVTLSELCAQLRIPTQTLYDLRSQGRGPRGFRVGRQLRFRRREIDAWLGRLESEDEDRHPAVWRR